MKRAILGVAVLLSGIASIASSAAQAKSLKEQLVGTWELSSLVSTSDSGEKSTPYSEHPLGTYMFDEAGRFAEIIINPDKEGVVVGYYGTYSVDDVGKGFVLHVIGGTAKRFNGADAKREVISISDDTLETHNPNPSRGGSAVSDWRKVK
jgi:hypothetical protein